MQRLKIDLSEFEKKKKEAWFEGKRGSAKQGGNESLMTLEAEVSALKVEEESDKRKLAALEIQSQVSHTEHVKVVTSI